MESSICLQRSDECELREFVIAALAVEVFMLVFIIFCKVYDLSTAMIFSFSLGFLARGKFKEFYVLYPLGCMNRETMFLLSIFFAVHFMGRLEIRDWFFGLGYQGGVFVSVRLMIMKIFEGNPGQRFYLLPGVHLRETLAHPMMFILLCGLVIVTWYFVARDWMEKPKFLRLALCVILPLQVVLYFLLGKAYEIRVFAEVFPVVWCLMFQVPSIRWRHEAE